MNQLNKKIAVTTGDVNGIGAEITIKALKKLRLPKENVVLVSNSDVLNFYGGKNLSDLCQIEEIHFDKKYIIPGKLSKESGEFSFQCLKKACEMARGNIVDAIVTAPVSKEAFYLSGHNFNGQTEVLQKFLAHDGQKAEMLFVANDFRVLLLTRHCALKDILITKNEIVEKISALNEFFEKKFKISAPKFALCALNPHAGEGGILGHEEIDIIKPAVLELQKSGVDITMPLPADTLFINAAKKYLSGAKQSFDCFIAMYHDQGLIPIKTVASEKTVNMTIGLDVIRTSPCHGTAFDIAGKNIADEGSMTEAIIQALKV